MIVVGKIIESMNTVVMQKMTEISTRFDFTHLTPELAEEFARALQSTLTAAGAAGYSCYIQSFDSDTDIIRHKGHVLRKKGEKVEKAYLTSFGEMTIARSLYQADRGGKSVIPLDEQWGMSGQYATVEVREAVAFTVAHCTPVETEAILKKIAPFKPSETAITHMLEGVGSVFEEHKEEIQEHVLLSEEIPSQAKVIVRSLDGVNVLLREEGSRDRRPAERPGKAGSERDVESCYKNAMVGSLSFYSGEREADGSPKRICSRYVSAMPQENARDFKRTLERETDYVLSDPLLHKVTKVVIIDGSLGLWGYVQSNPQYDDFIPVIDFYHTTEHLSKASEALFGKQNLEGQAWYAKLKGKLLHEPDGAEAVLRSIDYYSMIQKLPSWRRDVLRAERRFFNRNHSRMNYAYLRKKGIPIGSGPVEAACKSIVKNRLCRSGMRWSREGGQKILTFRTFVKSERWDAAWEGYKKYAQAA